MRPVIDKVSKDIQYLQPILKIYEILISTFEAKDPKETAKQKLEFLAYIKPDILKIINPENYSKIGRDIDSLLRQFFIFYANNEIYYIEGLKFFSLFPDLIKQDSFNSIKAFLFYFAYQSKHYTSKEVKELLDQNLLMCQIFDHRTYLDFCMYCFYRGMHFLENRDFYMASYYYCAAVESGIKSSGSYKLLNGFSCQMIRSLCFLKYLTNFDVKNNIFKESRYHNYDEASLIDHQDVSLCLSFIKKDDNNSGNFRAFCLENDENIKKCSLLGLKKLAEEEIIFKTIKNNLKIFKRIKLPKLATLTQLDYNEILTVLKKKVLQGELNIKYDQSEEIIEIFDLEPGLKERVEKTKELYERVLKGNKNLFMNLKTRKMNKMAEKEAKMIINIPGAENFVYGDMGDSPMEEDDD